MAGENKEVIIQVQVNAPAVAEKLANATASVAALKAEQKDLEKQFKDGTLSAQVYGRAIAENKARLEQAQRTVKSSTAILQAANIESVKQTQSLDEQRQAVNTLQKAYASLSGEEKEAADQEGGLRDQIKQATDNLKEQEQAIGDARRNVGNYTESMMEAFNQLGQSAQLIGTAAGMLGTMGERGKKAATALQSLQKIMAFVAQAGKMQTTAAQAATTATNAQTTATTAAETAQLGLNAAMKANPIGILITAFTTLLPIVQSFCDGSREAEAAQAAFNLALAGTERALQSLQSWYDMDAKMARALGASEEEVYRIQIEGAKKAADVAQQAEDEAYEAYMSATGKKKEVAREYYEKAQEESKKAYDALNALMSESIIAETQRRTAENKKRTEDNKKAAEQRRADEIEQWDLARQQREIIERQSEAAIKQIRNEINEEEEEEDTAGLERLMSLLKVKKDMQAQFEGDAAEERYNADIAALDELNAARLLKDEEYQKLKSQIQTQYEAERAAEVLDYMQQAMGAIQAVSDAFAASQKAELAEYEAANNEKKKSLEKRLKDGAISQEQYDDEVAKLDAELDKKQKEMEYEQAKRNKAFNIMQSVINTALAIVNALATTPFPASIAMAAFAGVTGLAQTAAIAAEPLPQFAEGGVVPGNSYSGDRVLVRANSGETILTRGQSDTLIDIANNGVAGGIDYELLGATMAQAVAAQPAPVMVYDEFERFGESVAQFNEIASI